MANGSAPVDLYTPEFSPGWSTRSLFGLATWINGMAFRNAHFSSTGTPVVKIAEVKKGTTAQTKFTSDQHDDKYFLRDGDMLFCWSGQPETSIGTYWWAGGDGWLNQHIFKVVPDSQVVLPGFLFQLLQYLRPAFVQIARNKQTTGLGHVTKTDLERLEIGVPPLEEQQGIAAVLGAFDDGISSALDVAAREVQLAIAKLSTGKTAVRVGDVATVKKGLSYKGSGLDDGSSQDAKKMLNLANFTTLGTPKRDGLKFYTGDHKPDHVLRTGELVTANTDLTQAREILGRGFIVARDLDGAIHTHHTSVVRFEDHRLAYVLWAQLQSSRFRERAKGFATGTTVTALPAEALLNFEIMVPPDLDAVLGGVKALLEHSWHLEAEASRLRVTQDTLRPEIFTGRIRVGAVSPALTEAVA